MLRKLTSYTLLLLFLINLTNSFAEKDKIKWGLVLPLSGPVAKAGIDIQRGFKLAINEINKKSKFKHVLFYEDSQFIAKNAVSAATKLITSNKVDILVSLWDTADPIAPIAERYNILHTPIRWNSDIAHKYENTFTFESTYKDYARDFANLFSKLKFKKVALLSHESPGWLLAANAFREYAKSKSFKIVLDITFSKNPDYKLLALKALSKKPDVIFLNDFSESMNLFTKKVRTLNPNQMVTGYLGYPMDLSFYNKTYFIDQLSLDVKFANKFEDTYGEKIYTRAQLANDLANIVAGVYERFENKATIKKVVKGLKNIKSYTGTSGPISKSDDGKVFKTKNVCKFIEAGKIKACNF